MPLWRRKSKTVWNFDDNFSIHVVTIPDQTVLASFGHTITPDWYGQLIHACLLYTAAAGPGNGRFAIRSLRGARPVCSAQSTTSLPAAAASRANWAVCGNQVVGVNLVHNMHMLPHHFFVYPGDHVEFISTNTVPGDTVSQIFLTFKRWEIP